MKSFPGHSLRLTLSLATLALGVGCGTEPEPTPAEETPEQLINRQIEAYASPEWKQVRTALERFRDVDVAIAEGYVNTEFCETNVEGHAMGIHFAKFPLLEDDKNDPYNPEMLLYVPKQGGGYTLVGVEYYQAYTGQATPPTVLGHGLDGPMLGHGPGNEGPVHYDLHVWLYDYNVSGLFSQYNPKTSCGN
jgi:hypothetical protein